MLSPTQALSRFFVFRGQPFVQSDEVSSALEEIDGLDEAAFSLDSLVGELAETDGDAGVDIAGESHPVIDAGAGADEEPLAELPDDAAFLEELDALGDDDFSLDNIEFDGEADVVAQRAVGGADSQAIDEAGNPADTTATEGVEPALPPAIQPEQPVTPDMPTAADPGLADPDVVGADPVAVETVPGSIGRFEAGDPAVPEGSAVADSISSPVPAAGPGDLEGPAATSATAVAVAETAIPELQPIEAGSAHASPDPDPEQPEIGGGLSASLKALERTGLSLDSDLTNLDNLPPLEDLKTPEFVISRSGIRYRHAGDIFSEVIDPITIFPLPKSPVWLSGLINLRGSLIPVFDLGRIYRAGDTIRPGIKIIVVGRGEDSIGLWIDGIPQQMSFDSLNETGVPEGVPEFLAGAVRHVYQEPQGPVFDVDFETLFKIEQR